MHFTQHLALVGLFAATALAAPTEDSCPQKPAKPAPAPTTNACGNDATPYCCNTDVFGFGSCYTYEFSSQCSQTVICCNAENSVQVCIGNAEIITPPYYPYDF
ncbi:MAG: hypothetical protein LQ349_006865 [Xanthoria aureola]|nr:MAG: hypothetical protein LQ349_006865 [Xanthoria aureola]